MNAQITRSLGEGMEKLERSILLVPSELKIVSSISESSLPPYTIWLGLSHELLDLIATLCLEFDVLSIVEHRPVMDPLDFDQESLPPCDTLANDRPAKPELTHQAAAQDISRSALRALHLERHPTNSLVHL
jgi:hypothetical protein